MERAKHFFEVADPRLAFVSTAELMKARDVYQASQYELKKVINASDLL